ncbi:MAG TPA: MBL fold metallo-hydrolase [Smithellaceae bacterium]|nr:MBL fold metallo-hydrolase [Smithellaceae bacterium]
MTLMVLGSESKGNCYLLESDSGVLIIEAGIRLSEVKKALNYDLSRVVGCLVTHQHGDHFKYAGDYAKAGINIYASAETLAKSETIKHRGIKIESERPFTVARHTVVPFNVAHNVPTLGFLIKHPEMGKLLFVTDSAFINNKFNGLNHVCIEANYDDPLLMNDRAIGKHMSIDTCMDFLRFTDMSQVRNIVLLHLSSGNSNASDFTSKVKKISRFATVHVADRGLKINLNLNPF